MDYRREIDGLRALAVVPVILFHAGLEAFSGGFVGVDVFFVISGYLITSIVLDEQRAGRFSLSRFYERRARRILPALFIVIFASLPLACLWLLPNDLMGFARSLLAVATFSSNLLFWSESGYFDAAAEGKPLLHTWSLAVEEQFYVLLPLFLMAALRWRTQRVVLALGGMAMVSFAISQWGAHGAPSASFFLLPARAWELLLGALVAFCFQTGFKPPDSRWLCNIGALCGVFMIVASVATLDASTPFPGLYALLPTVGTVLIIVFAHQGTWIGRVLGARWLVGIGLVSYSAYLWHQPLFAFARQRSMNEPGSAQMLALSALALALAYLTWRHVEQPFRKGAVVSRRSVLVMTIAGTLGLVGAGGAILWTNGLYDLKLGKEAGAVLQTASHSPQRNECHTRGRNYLKPEAACVYGSGPAQWAVLGDSHAVELAYALGEELKVRGQAVRHFSFSACPPVFGLPDKNTPCAKWTTEAVHEIVQDAALKEVVITYRLNAWLLGGHEKVYPAQPDSIEQQVREDRWHALLETVRHLDVHGKHVHLVLQAPELPVTIEALAFRSGVKNGVMLGAPADWWHERSRWVRERLNELPETVRILDPAGLFCDALLCHAALNGVALYFDDDHMSVAGARRIAVELLKTVPVP